MLRITVSELKGWLSERNDFELIDVREVWEHKTFNIGGKNIPLSELIMRKDELPTNGKIVFYCEKGIRSAIAIQRLQLHNEMYNLEGGMTAWRKMES